MALAQYSGASLGGAKASVSAFAAPAVAARPIRVAGPSFVNRQQSNPAAHIVPRGALSDPAFVTEQILEQSAAGAGAIAAKVSAPIAGAASTISTAAGSVPVPPVAAAAASSFATFPPALIAALSLGAAIILFLATKNITALRTAAGKAAQAVTAPFKRLAMKAQAKEAAMAILAAEKADAKDIDALSKEIYTTISGGTAALGDELEKGWAKRGSGSSLRRNIEIWRFAARSAFKVLGANKAKKKGVSDEEVAAKREEAATFIRDGLVRLGPTFVKLGQVVSTRTDIFSDDYIKVLKTLQDDVPAFSGAKSIAIVEKELGKPIDQLFKSFDEKPLAAASLGQVHRAVTKDGMQVAVKVQRAGLKELFDVDLKNLKKLAELLDKFDPKTDGADRCWADIYDESARLLYLEIDYQNESKNAAAFAKQFADNADIRVPKTIDSLTTPRVLTMEYVESFKLTDIPAVEKAGLNKEEIAKKTADAFLFQILNTGYFHCDPHPGNLCLNKQGQLVYYDYGMMAQLKPNVLEGFRDFCFALFDGGPLISDIELGRNAKKMVAAVEKMGVLAKGADQLSVEKLARFFIRTFKDVQLGKKGGNIKEALGNDLLALTNSQVFRFPSTFTFIFRAFASVDGIGKGLDPNYDISKLAQPFVEKLIFDTADRGTFASKVKSAANLTGLNVTDVNTAITSPKKILYIEETLREMEQGSLKIRVRALENETQLERLSLQQGMQNQLMVASLFVNVGLVAIIAEVPILAFAAYAFAAKCGFAALGAAGKVKKFDKKLAKYDQRSFEGAA